MDAEMQIKQCSFELNGPGFQNGWRGITFAKKTPIGKLTTINKEVIKTTNGNENTLNNIQG